MREFDSFRGFRQFEESVKTRSRFVPDKFVSRFLQTVRETAESRLTKLPKDQILFRAQRGHTYEPLWIDGQNEPFETEAALPPDRMVPTAEFVGDGRVNPRGIPCLYLASTASAAISEMRPWVGSYITLAQFKIARDCRIVDCSCNTRQSLLHEPVNPDEATEPDAATKDKVVWGDIGFAFSRPVTHDQPQLDYVPTQILAETFRDQGYDGIVYGSLLDKNGKNIALFDLDAATLIGRCLYKVRSAALQSGKLESDATLWPDSISSELHLTEL